MHKYFIHLLLAFLAGSSQMAVAQWYIGVGAASMDYDLDYDGGDESYSIDTTIIKAGYKLLSDETSELMFEARIYTGGDDTTIDPSGFNFETDIGNIFGVYYAGRFKGERVGFNYALGLLRLDTDYTALDVTSTPITDSDDVFMLDFGIGLNIKIVENLFATADYSYAFGTATYDLFFNDDVDASFSGFTIGVDYSF